MNGLNLTRRSNQPPYPPYGSHTLYITNIRPEMYRSEVRKIFSNFGEVTQINKNDNVVAVRFVDFNDCTRAAHHVDKRLLGNVQISFVNPTPKIEPIVDGSDTLFLANLRYGLSTSDLRQLFTVYGKVIEIDKNDCSASVKFLNPKEAELAIREIDRSKFGDLVEISLGKPATKSEKLQENGSGTLLVRNLRPTITTSDLRMFFSVYGDVDIIDKSDDFASIQFYKSEDAKEAAREIDKKLLGDGNVEISFKKPSSKSEKVVESSDLLYIRNLRPEMKTSDLRKFFSFYGEVMEIDKNDSTATIRFRYSKSAQAAREIDKKLLGDGNVDISLGISSPKSKHLQPNNEASYSLYIQDMNADINTSDLRKFFSAYGEIDTIDKQGNFASIRFRNSKVSKYAALEIGKSLLGGENVKISLVKPAVKCEKTVVEAGDTVEGWLYISNLRTVLSTSDLRKHFSVYGEVGKIDRKGSFACIQFRNGNDSKRAALYIDKKLLGDGNVKILFDNPDLKSEKTLDDVLETSDTSDTSDTLFITNLPHGLRSRQLRRLFTDYGKVMEIDKNDDTATIRFKNSKQANAASKIDKKLLGDGNVGISFKTPAPEGKQDDESLDESDTVCISNLASGVRSKELRDCFSVYGEIITIDRSDDYASVRFRKVENLQRAVREMDTRRLGNVKVTVSKCN